MSEGFSVTANIYRSKTAAERGEKVPVVTCAHPYNNHLTPALKTTPLGGAPQQQAETGRSEAYSGTFTSSLTEFPLWRVACHSIKSL